MVDSDSSADQVIVRRATEDELESIIDCCTVALGWNPGEPNADFFRWKHRDNHFGPSPIWVAVDGGQIVGVRALMQWRLQRGDAALRLVRAVDTATLPSHQGQGIFRRLTTAAVDELTAEGCDAIFNTPNDKSRPGYLKMGWTEIGRVPIGLRLRAPSSAWRLRNARTAAGKWGEPMTAGRAAANLDAEASSWIAPEGWHTPISADYLAWRYGFEPLGYRYLDGAIVRVRTRGSVKELSVCEVLGAAPAVGSMLRAENADVAIATGLGPRAGFIPAPGLGPRLTWRELGRAETPTMDDLALSLGTIELF